MAGFNSHLHAELSSTLKRPCPGTRPGVGSEELLAQGLDIMTDVPRLTFAFNQNKIVQDCLLQIVKS